jgi:hypothetical protein
MRNFALMTVLMAQAVLAYDPRYMGPNPGAYTSNPWPTTYPQGQYPIQPSYNPQYPQNFPNQGHSNFPLNRDMRGIDPRMNQNRGPRLEEIFSRARAAIQKLDRLSSNEIGAYDGFENEYRQYLYQNGGYAQVDYKGFVNEKASLAYQQSVQEFVQYFRDNRVQELSWKLTTGEEVFSHVHRLLENLSRNNQFSANDFLEITAAKELAINFLDRATISDELRHEIILDMRKISSIYHDRMGVHHIELMPALFQHTRDIQSGEIRERRPAGPQSGDRHPPRRPPQVGDRAQRNPLSTQQ